MINAESGGDTSKKVTLDNQTTSYGIFQVSNPLLSFFKWSTSPFIYISTDQQQGVVPCGPQGRKVQQKLRRWVAPGSMFGIAGISKTITLESNLLLIVTENTPFSWVCVINDLLSMSAPAFLTDDISDDIDCAKQIHKDQGFSYWKGWVNKCKQKPLPDISMCWKWGGRKEQRTRRVRICKHHKSEVGGRHLCILITRMCLKRFVNRRRNQQRNVWYSDANKAFDSNTWFND